jgi:Thiamine-binding protein
MASPTPRSVTWAPSASLNSHAHRFFCYPLGAGEGVGEIVAEAVRVVRESGLPNQTNSMFITIEGEWVGVDFYTVATTEVGPG